MKLQLVKVLIMASMLFVSLMSCTLINSLSQYEDAVTHRSLERTRYIESMADKYTQKCGVAFADINKRNQGKLSSLFHMGRDINMLSKECAVMKEELLQLPRRSIYSESCKKMQHMLLGIDHNLLKPAMFVLSFINMVCLCFNPLFVDIVNGSKYIINSIMSKHHRLTKGYISTKQD